MAKVFPAVVVAIVSLSPLVALAQNTTNSHPGWTNGTGNPHGSAPLPIVGAGLPGLVVAGFVYLVSRRKQTGR
jgi:hypothetical protein